MMVHIVWVVLVLIVAFAIGAWALIRLFSIWNSEDGERYQRMRMQGPFVPLSAEDVAEDECRSRR